ncbi:hypothetical protein RclHR1_08930007 [Rhizophagus clarus]|uniref:Uncharacterized protein n=1 Tax=Rhizophagus clarus TaxID=94130 RepID=A0A2Z6S2P1_9GLOM|nr:hypothetical protein RclHR1_08930007 [Rhizophagus clarus]
MEEWCAKWKVVREGERYYRQFRTRFWDRPGNHHSRRRRRNTAHRRPQNPLPVFLDELDLGNVASLLGRTRLGKCCQSSWTNQTWKYCWTPDLKHKEGGRDIF